MKINFFEYQKLYLEHKKEYLKIFNDVCSRGAFILQKDLENFEKSISKYLNIKYVLGTNDGTNALILGLMANDISSGDEIILPSHTYIATAAAIKLVGAKPVFADINSKDNLVSPESIRKKITSKTKAIMPVHVNGRICDMVSIKKIAKKYKLKIIEDGAQSIGAKLGKYSTGHYGDCATISFYPAKILGCFGDGGAILTNNEKIYSKLFKLRDHGRNKKGDISLWGTNARLDNLQAAFLNYKLKFLDKDIKKRRRIAYIYDSELSFIKNLNLIPGPNSNDINFDVYQNYEIAADNRDKLKKYLLDNNIKTLVQWNGKAVHQIKPLKLKAAVPNTELFFKRCIMLPIHTFLNEKEVMYICQKIKNFYKTK
jgi:dTDP-4-amino-4,6-dideoxygalactose transaminase